MLKTELDTINITLDAIPNTPVYRIRMNGRMIGHIGSKDGANVNLFHRYDGATVEHIRQVVAESVTNRIKSVAIAPHVSDDANPRADDGIDDFEP